LLSGPLGASASPASGITFDRRASFRQRNAHKFRRDENPVGTD
jgi:hypothetical protein